MQIIITPTVLFLHSLLIMTFGSKFHISDLRKAARRASSACAVWVPPANASPPRDGFGIQTFSVPMSPLLAVLG